MSMIVVEDLLHQATVAQTLQCLPHGLPRRGPALRGPPVAEHRARRSLRVRVVLRAEALELRVGNPQLDAQVLPVHADPPRNLRELLIRDENCPAPSRPGHAPRGCASSRSGDRSGYDGRVVA